MKKFLLLVIVVTIKLSGFSQSFEGTLTYKVTFEFSQKISQEIKDKTFEHLQNNGEYYDTLFITIKHADYLKIDNAPNGKKTIYNAAQNKLYFFTKGSKIVMTTSADLPYPPHINLPDPKIEYGNSTIQIGAYECNYISLAWEGTGKEIYYYNPSIASINPELFKDHDYEYLSLILEKTKAYPIKMVKSLNNFMTISMELVSIDDSKIENDFSRVPRLKKVSKKQVNAMGYFTNYDVMIVID